MQNLYEITATAQGGRNGHVTSSDGVLDLQLALPKGLGGPGGAAPNPEMLFAAGYAACFDSALAFVATQRKVSAGATRVDATVGIGPRADRGFALSVQLRVQVPGLPPEEARALVEAAHAICPYSHAVRGNIAVTLELA